MFTWICPQCGREVPPSYGECPDCAAKEQAAAAQPEAMAPQPAPSVRAPKVRPPAAEHTRIPGWLVALGVALLLVGIGAGALRFLRPSARQAEEAEKRAAPLQTVSAAPAPTAGKIHPWAKYIEVTGFRITEDLKQRAQVKFLVVNHSGAELVGLGLEVAIRTEADKPEAQPLATFAVKNVSLGPYESKEFDTKITTKLRAYELPDWQFLKTEFRIISPAM